MVVAFGFVRSNGKAGEGERRGEPRAQPKSGGPASKGETLLAYMRSKREEEEETGKGQFHKLQHTTTNLKGERPHEARAVGAAAVAARGGRGGERG